MADTNLKVQIKFQATGDKELARAFKTAAVANEKLEKQTKKLNKANKKLKKGMFDVSKSLRLSKNSFATLRSKMLLASFAAGLVAASFGKVVQEAMKFEKVKVRLNAMFGSVEAGSRAFEKFNKIAATTPFTLTDVVEAGAALKAFGADAERLIKPVSDLAAFMGTTAAEAASALGRAFAGGAGAADILRERGILQLVKDSQGLDDLTKLTLPEFRKAVEETILDPSVGIAGATDALSKTMTGLVSNLGDSFSRLGAALGEGIIHLSGAKAFVPALTEMFSSLTNAITKLNETDEETFIRLLTALGASSEQIANIKKTSDPLTKLGGDLFDLEQIFSSFINTQETLGEGFKGRMGIFGFLDPLKEFVQLRGSLEEGLSISGTAFQESFELNLKAMSDPALADKFRDAVAQLRRDVEIEKELLFGKDPSEAVNAQLEQAGKMLDVFIPALEKLIPAKIKEIAPEGLISFDDLITFDDDDDEMSFASKFAKKMAEEGSATAAELMEIAKILLEKKKEMLEESLKFQKTIDEAEAMNLTLREEMFSKHFNTILSMAQKNLDARKNAELQTLRDTDAFRNASSEERETMEKDALKQFQSRQKMLFRLNQLNEIAKVVMSTHAAISDATLMIARLEIASKFYKGTGNFAMAALAKSQIPGIAKDIGFSRASAAAQIGLIAGQQAPAFARGGSFVTGGEQFIKVGDNSGGRERVDITPLSSPDFGDAGGGSSINVNIMGNVIGTQEFVRDNLLPEIENTIKRNLA